MTMWRYVRIATATTLEIVWAAIQRLAEPRHDPLRQDVLAVHAQAEARHRDADLRRGDVAILLPRILEDPRYALGQTVAARGLVVDHRPRRAHDGELGRDEQPVGDDQQQDDGDRNDDVRHSRSSSGSGVRRRTSTESTARSITRSTSNS